MSSLLVISVLGFLGALAKLRTATITFVMSVCHRVLMEQFGFHWTNFHEILYLSIIPKSALSLKPDKINRYLVWRPMYIYDTISVSSSWNENVSDKRFWENKKLLFLPMIYSRKPCLLWSNMEKYGSTRQVTHIWQCDMTHALSILYNWDYRHTLRICNTYAFSTATMVIRKRLNVMLYVHCLSFLFECLFVFVCFQ
jgi:hypothetical protein